MPAAKNDTEVNVSTAAAAAAGEWCVGQSAVSARMRNPIREILEKSKPSSSAKEILKLSIGDPTYDGNLLPHPAGVKAFAEVVASGAADGYAPGQGVPAARAAVAAYWGSKYTTDSARAAQLTAEHTLMTSGGSHAIQVAITAIAGPGDSVLIPAPGFPHYTSICTAFGIECRYYHLRAEDNWTADAREIERLTDSTTKLLIMTNPSNPCGSNWSRAEVAAMVETASRLRLPLFSDEIYCSIVYAGTADPARRTFTSVADIDSDAPRLILGGTAKTHVVPGWRIGWLLFCDPRGVGAAYWQGVINMAMMIVGPCGPAQAALPAVLEAPDDTEYIARNTAVIEEGANYFAAAVNAEITHSADARLPLLSATVSNGAMYVMVRIHEENFDTAGHPEVFAGRDASFCAALLDEQNVMVVPGVAFRIDGYFRVVITRPVAVLAEAVARMKEFARKYEKKL